MVGTAGFEPATDGSVVTNNMLVYCVQDLDNGKYYHYAF